MVWYYPNRQSSNRQSSLTMNRTDRLLAIVLELQAHGTRRAEDLAATFEISKRTVYRDVQALCEAGVPVVAEPGRGYSLVEGYFLPPLRFSADEAVMLLLGADVMAQSFDADYRAAAETACRKIAGALPAPTRDAVTALRESLRFVPGESPQQPEVEERLRMLRGAMVGRQRVGFAYTARHAADDAPPVRQADPYGLVFVNNVWNLVAFDHTRQELRHFRLDRMAQLELLAQRFERPADFRLQRQERDDRTLVVRLLFEPAVARWVRENRSFYTTSEEETPDGLLVTLHVRQEREI
ncbi:MAG: YafY family transcriptional regulator, partial [Chloroflexaceae bacterium]|nr:YafY family transcriptional regulator [Chloroflexaceae bacterium]